MPILPATILVVDDDETITNVVAELIETAGYTVRTACSGDEALDLLKREKVDLAFIDINMPNISGYDLAALMQDSYPDIAIVLSTGYAGLLSHDMARERRFPIIMKPYTLTTMTEFFDDALAKRLLPPVVPDSLKDGK